jgi:hypothetical protein
MRRGRAVRHAVASALLGTGRHLPTTRPLPLFPHFTTTAPPECGKGGAPAARRTTYMFTYLDAEPGRPDFEKLLDAYFHLLPAYQGVPLDALRFK